MKVLSWLLAAMMLYMAASAHQDCDAADGCDDDDDDVSLLQINKVQSKEAIFVNSTVSHAVQVKQAKAHACLCAALEHKLCDSRGVRNTDSDFGCHWTMDDSGNPVCGGYGFTCDCAAFDPHYTSKTRNVIAVRKSECEQIPGCERYGRFHDCKTEVRKGQRCFTGSCINAAAVLSEVRAARKAWLEMETKANNNPMATKISRMIDMVESLAATNHAKWQRDDSTGIWTSKQDPFVTEALAPPR
eukprot:gnl/TRDRNA2_/TRDRNA2_188160_c0_seq1.p1 gnl/TRDRNA2_/TRDRNA2_188160_c0~~gnl/TRDRNA2_/TRDRNA2_188160_c0_seq1.p1  ORF type:complete len:244 (+),score=51.90 gnl/TRDRNA2_/TRDRNA2_188160_c0_seq1:85-816(+)